MSRFAWVTNAIARFWPTQGRVYVPSRQAGVLVNEDTALTFAAVWACVSVISRTIAALPWQVFEKTESGRKPLDSQVAWLLNNRPNPEMTAFSFREALMVHVLTWGNGYAEIQRDAAGRVVALLLLTPDRVTPARGSAGQLVYRVTDATGNQVELGADDVLHVHGMGFDGLVGYSPIRMAARSIGLGMAQDVFGQAFYANGTVIGTMIEMPGSMNVDQIALAEKYYNDSNRGPGNAFKVKVTPTGAKLHPLGMPLVDAQFIATREFSVTEISRWYGVPPHKIGDLTRSTNNNIEHQGIEFVTDAIVPWAARLEQEANTKLFGYRAQGRVYTKLNVNALMRGDAKSRAEYYRTMTQIGALSINQVLEMEDMNGIGADGDEHLVQLNQTTLEWLVENPGAKANTAAVAGEQSPGKPAADAAPPEDQESDDPAPTNVIRATALEWYRQQRNQA